MAIREIQNSKFKIQKRISAYYSTFLILNFAFLIFSSCSFKKEIPPPTDLISADTMEFILVDLTMNEAALNSGIANDTLKKINVLANYKVSLQRFDSSFTYYTKNPQKLKDIYTNVLEDLNQK
ncbi:MAG: DUF4296 domain-containing protein [Bacteroidia bacterium]